jgi:Ca2+-binding RTX toxin-like protein
MATQQRRFARAVVVAGLAVVGLVGAAGPASADPVLVPLTDCFGNRIVVGLSGGPIYAQPGVDTYGTNGDDVIIGTNGPDRIFARGGNDIVCGAGGADTIYGGNTSDDIGVDHLDGEHGQDVIYAGGDNDVVLGGEGNDILYGEEGNDSVRGESEMDFLNCGGGLGDFGDGGTNPAGGGPENDSLAAGHGCETVSNVP